MFQQCNVLQNKICGQVEEVESRVHPFNGAKGTSLCQTLNYIRDLEAKNTVNFNNSGTFGDTLY